MKKQINILIIEDNEDDTMLEIDLLRNGGYDIVYERVETRKAMKSALKEQNWDCIISDYSLPQFSGLDALTELKESGIDIPFILISGAMGEETAVAAMRAGAQDYIMKNNLKRLVPALERELRDSEVRLQKRQAEEETRYERILLRTLIDNIPDSIYFKDNECKIIAANSAEVKFNSRSNENDLLGKTDLELQSGDAATYSYEEDLSILKTGKPIINKEEQYKDQEGKLHWVHTTKMPIKNEQGKITGLVGLRHDITERKLSELALLESEQNLLKQNQEYQVLNMEYLALNDKLRNSFDYIQRMNSELIVSKNRAQESDRLKSSFLANMSHEIRTPLNAIIGFSSFLRDEGLDKDKTEAYCEIIDSSGHQLLTIINDILDISKIEAGQLVITKGSVNISHVLREIFQQYKKAAELKNLSLVYTNASYTDDVIINTDESRLRQILCNLVDNAIKFTTEGKVEFGFTIDSNFVSILVKDSGIGISRENQSVIFKPFRQVETTATRNYRGNGLGLSISKALVEMLGGTLTLWSDAGNGSTFTFTIPYVQSSVTVKGNKAELLQSGKQNWNRHVILVVEDEMYNYSYLEKSLSSTNVGILHAWNGVEAIEIVKTHPEISLVLMDIRMPEMDGYTATSKIKELRPQLPIIAQTAYAFAEDKEKALKVGFDNYLTKPSSREYMVEVIGNYLN
jgi:PAS domain S-box-containing protein